MLNKLAALALLCVGTLAYAQAPNGPTISQPQPEVLSIPMVSGTAGDILQLVNASAAVKLPDGPWVGKSQLSALPSLALAQSCTSTDQALGIHKDLWSLYKGGYEIVRVGGFGGFYKPLFTSSGPRSLAGGTVLVPGSALDWALGTNYGDKYLPALKSGILVAYDVTRPKSLSWNPNFIGPILSYKLGQSN